MHFWKYICHGLAVAAFALASLGQSVVGQVPSQKAQALPPLNVFCSPESPIVQPGETITINAWPNTNGKLTYHWSAEAGTIAGNSKTATWTFEQVVPGRYRAEVVVTDSGGLHAQCSAQIVVREGLRTGPTAGRETGRSFLIRNKNEQRPFGLYSYLLFGSAPTDSSRQKYLVTLDAYLRFISTIERLEDEMDREQLNVTYLPVDQSLPEPVTAEWLLAHYDYARARALISRIPGDHRDGPYIVSALEPLSQAGTLLGPYLFQDLTLVPSTPKDLIVWWLREFLNQSAQQDFSKDRTCERLALKVRTAIAILAIGFPDVKNALDTSVSWFH